MIRYRPPTSNQQPPGGARGVRVRFAPSPTGALHVGSARTALFNYLFARRYEGVFILRIEDTDAARSEKAHVDQILHDLAWLGLRPDEGPFFQSQRLELYRRALDQLSSRGVAYPCFCSKEILDRKRQEAKAAGRDYRYDRTCLNLEPSAARKKAASGQPHVFRLKNEGNERLGFHDLIYGFIAQPNLYDDFVLSKSDGTPVYHFACVVDDLDMGITHVIRGDDHLSNTPRQLLIYRALGKEPPAFAHLPMIHGPDGTKLSKRHGAKACGEYQKSGILPEAMCNFLARLGWAYDDKTEVFTPEDLARRFSLQGIGKSPARFDAEKLFWFNQKHIGLLSDEELARRLDAFYPGKLPLDRWRRAAVLLKPRIRTLAEAWSWVDWVEARPPAPALKEEEQALLKRALPLIEQAPFENEGLERTLKEFCEREQVKSRQLFSPLRLLLTGKKVSPPITETMLLLGKEETLQRLREGLRGGSGKREA